MDDYTDTNIEEEIQKAECEVDCEMVLIDSSIPELGSLATHTRLCEMGADRARRQRKAKHRRRH